MSRPSPTRSAHVLLMTTVAAVLMLLTWPSESLAATESYDSGTRTVTVAYAPGEAVPVSTPALQAYPAIVTPFFREEKNTWQFCSYEDGCTSSNTYSPEQVARVVYRTPTRVSLDLTWVWLSTGTPHGVSVSVDPGVASDVDTGILIGSDDTRAPAGARIRGTLDGLDLDADGATDVDIVGRRLRGFSITGSTAHSNVIDLSGLGVETKGNGLVAWDGDDTLVGTAAPDSIRTGNGVNTARGLGSKDIIYAGAGNDDIDGGPGNDSIMLGYGADRARGGAGNDFIQSLRGNAQIWGGPGEDNLSSRSGRGHLKIWGGPGNDSVGLGPQGTAEIWLGSGNDSVVAGKNLKAYRIDCGAGKDRTVLAYQRRRKCETVGRG
jgi:RTX calcium-binding nonapeptide repeat (4 copies)